MKIRVAESRDAAAAAKLISLAYRVEDFFKIGDRTDEADVLARMKKGGVSAARRRRGRAGRLRLRRNPRGHGLLRHAVHRPGAAGAGPRLQTHQGGRRLLPRARLPDDGARGRQPPHRVAALLRALRLRCVGHPALPRQRVCQAPLPLHRHDASRCSRAPDADNSGPCSRPTSRNTVEAPLDGSHRARLTGFQEDGWQPVAGQLCVRGCCWQVASSFQRG